MTRIAALLARTRLTRDRTPPSGTVPPHHTPLPDSPLPADPATATAAAEDLRVLCEALVTHTPAAAVADFVTNQVPAPRSALVLACVLQLTDTDDGARFWWQYAAGADQSTAAYCLYLHHLALGDRSTADWWHRQTDDAEHTQPPQSAPAPHHFDPNPSTSTFLRMLRLLTRHTQRPRSTKTIELMTCLSTAVTAGYLREPDMDLPLPGDDFADRIRTLLTTPPQPAPPNDLPTRPRPDTASTGHPSSNRHPQTKRASPTSTGTGRYWPSSAAPRWAAPRRAYGG
ncbi:hypothetical protein [uncultured Streptomyces sp.]|uniref:hypothetical protein n=1 Tax=uncultured Streptomyces sp. TaxID=174707 RepID=UPI0026016552|nr:hypothetical protein [uncultured Streptomyces sp.]